MTAEEKHTIVDVAAWCIKRVRSEGFSKKPDYEIAADDICNHLAFFLDWLRMIKIEEDHEITEVISGGDVKQIRFKPAYIKDK